MIELNKRNTTKLISHFSDFSRILQSSLEKEKEGFIFFCRKDPGKNSIIAIGSLAGSKWRRRLDRPILAALVAGGEVRGNSEHDGVEANL